MIEKRWAVTETHVELEFESNGRTKFAAHKIEDGNVEAAKDGCRAGAKDWEETVGWRE